MKKVIATVAAFFLVGTLTMNAQQEPAKKEGAKKEQKEGDKKVEHKGGKSAGTANKAENNGRKNTTTAATPKN
ncbi:MAG: hypothetical protein ABI388_00775 [Bacteroidia bacterium]